MDKAATYLMRKSESDFFMIVFRGMDWIQHYLWNHIDLLNPIPENKLLVSLIKEYYELVDNYIGKIIRANNDKTIFVISDHGFTGLTAMFRINEYLSQKGYLFKNKSTKSNVTINLLNRAKSFLGSSYNKLLMNKYISWLNNIRVARINKFIASIDWGQTVAFSNREGGISINLKGRDPKGIVAPGKDYDILRERIINDLSELKYDHSGESVFYNIYKRENLNLDEKYIHNAPDILFEPADGFDTDINIDLTKDSLPIFYHMKNERYKYPTGVHKRKGILIAKGENVKNNFDINRAHVKITDIPATILKIMGIPIPHDMDGRVLKEIYKASD